ncbi:FUSC family protein [Streptomyces sp. J2-1]|nr:FUSC family protein [Streptomyces corallincola]
MPVAATYGLFAAVAVGGLSKIPGSGRQRATTGLCLLPVCLLLVVLGTYLSVRTWSAVAGMLVIGFALAFSAVGGPREAGAAPGLQLLYILPSFPPYDPASLPERLLGTTAGLLLFAAAEVLVLPAPGAPPYRERVAHAAGVAADCAARLTRPPYALTPAEVRTAAEAGHALRPLTVPEAERPAGPGVRDRALTHVGLATRTLLSRLAQPPAPPCAGAGPEPTAVVRAVAGLATATAACLRGGPSPGAEYEELSAARQRLVGAPVADARTAAAPESAFDAHPVTPAVLRRQAAALEIADAALAMSTAADLAVHGRHASVRVAPGRFWYATTSAPLLWWHRLEGHAGRRSVCFQNAVRIALALTAARLVAGVDTLPHGFWAMLATLTLTRTTTEETRSTVRRALAGTVVGALATAGLLVVAGTDSPVYAAFLPLWMLIAFTVGPVKGVGWAQGMFTVVVALVFAQLEPSTWQLAEFRLLDVLVGSAIGMVFGLVAWPRGAHNELRFAAAQLLRGAAEIVVATSASVTGGGTAGASPGEAGHRSLRRAVILAESAYAQYQSEPAPYGPRAHGTAPRGVDWQATLMAGHHTLWGSERLLDPPPGPLRPEVATTLGALGDRVAGRMLLVSAALDPGGDTPTAPVPHLTPDHAAFSTEPPGAPRRYYATVSWLESLMTDLSRIARDGSTAELPPDP